MTAPAPLPVDEQHRLIVENQALVHHIAKYMATSLSHEDKVSAGNIGMVIAASKYDPMRCVQFGTYASYWIRAYILKAAIADREMPNTKYGRKVFFGIRKAVRDCEQAGVEATNARLGRMLDVPEEYIAEIRGRALAADSHYDATGFADEGGFMGALVSESDPDAAMDADKSADRIATLLEGLSERERDVIRRRYLSDVCETLTEIGETWGVTRERVRQVEAMAFRKLRPRMIRSER